MPQTTFTVDPGLGQAGQLASSADYQLNSTKAEGAVAAGLFVVRGTDPAAEGTVPGAAGDITDVLNHLGFAWHDPSRLSPTDYADADLMTYLEKGEIFVDSETAVTAGDAVEIRYAGAGTFGAARSGNVGAETAALPNAVFVNTTAAAGLAVVKFHV